METGRIWTNRIPAAAPGTFWNVFGWCFAGDCGWTTSCARHSAVLISLVVAEVLAKSYYGALCCGFGNSKYSRDPTSTVRVFRVPAESPARPPATTVSRTCGPRLVFPPPINLLPSGARRVFCQSCSNRSVTHILDTCRTNQGVCQLC